MKIYVCWENCEQIVKVFDSKIKAIQWVENEDIENRTGCGFKELELQ